MVVLYLISVWLHIVGAAVWVGGMVFLSLVLLAVLRQPDSGPREAELAHVVSIRFRNLGWAALGVLVVTGLFNLTRRGVGGAVPIADLWGTPFGHALAIKLALVGIVVAISAVHDFVIGPRAARAWRGDPDAARTRRLRRVAGWIGRLNLLLALTIMALGVVLVRGWPW